MPKLRVLEPRSGSQGAILSGVSAGMLCWFEGGITDSFGGYRPLRDGLGLLRGTACPHYGGEPQRQSAFRRFVAGGAPLGYASKTVSLCISLAPA